MSIRYLPDAAPIPRPHWRTIILRVSDTPRPGFYLCLAGTLHDVAANSDGASEAIRQVAEGEIAMAFLGEPTHTTIERAR